MDYARTRVRGPGWFLAFGLVVALGLSAQDTTPDSTAGDGKVWVAHSRGISAVDAADGQTTLELAIQTGARAVAVDSGNDVIWTLAQQFLVAHSRAGIPLYQAEIPSPRGESAFMDVDRDAGIVWVATHSQVLAFDATGQLLIRHRLPKQLSAGALDTTRGQYWYAYDDIVGTIDATGAVLRTVRLSGVKTISGLGYAAESDLFWMLADDSLRQISSDGVAGAPVANGRFFTDLIHISADGTGGLWAADRRNLYRLDSAGNLLTAVRPFEGESPEAIQALLAVSSDGTTWAASQRTVVHVDVDGTILLRAVPGEDKTRNIAAIALEATDAGPRIQFTAPDNGVFLNDNRPELRVTFSGPDLDSGTLSFSNGGVPLSVTCNVEPAAATCIPQNALTDGEAVIQATIASVAGSISLPAEVRFTVDTIAPTITVEAPMQGFLTNSSQLTIHGKVDEPADVTVNSNDATVEGLGFSFGPVSLVEGGNTFEIVATDRAGNSTVEVVTGTLDTIPPPPPAQSLIQVTASGESLVITGSAGSVEGGATVTVRNLRSGESVQVVTGADGSFSAALSGAPGDEIQIVATDPAGNASTPTVIVVPEGPGVVPDPRFSGPLDVLSISPSDGTVVAAQTIVVSVTLVAPPNTGVTVNSIVATPVASPDGLQYLALVPLEVGDNEIDIQVRSQDGRVLTRTRHVSSTALDPYRVIPSPEIAMSPAEVEFRILDHLRLGIWEVEVDFDNDGLPDLITEETRFTHTFAGTGLRTVSTLIFDNWGDGHVVTTPIILADPDVEWNAAQAVWGAMNDALIAGDIESALQYLTEPGKEQYRAIFEELLERMPAIIDSYSELMPATIGEDFLEGGVNRTIDNVLRVFLITFVKDDRGMWQLDSM